MSFLSVLSDILTAPIKMISNWAEEPLKRSEHSRQEDSRDRDVQRDIQQKVGVETALSNQRIKEQEHQSSLNMKEQVNHTNLQIKRETEVEKELSNQRMKEQELQSSLNLREQSHQTDQLIKRETEIVRIITEIEQLKKDKEFERMKAVSDAMMTYQTELTRINVEAVEAIGNMRIELQRKAYDLIHEKTMQYNELQEKALQQAADQLERIDNNPNMSEASRNIMMGAVDKKLAGIIDNATRFLVQLNDDMQLISKDINLITSSGQNFIQRHLEQFQLIGFSESTTALLNDSGDMKRLN